MTVWQIRLDIDTYCALVPADREPLDVTMQFNGQKNLLHSWQLLPVTIAVGTAESVCKLGDFSDMAVSYVPIFGERALNVLFPLVKESIEVLPLIFHNGKFYAINVEAVDCIDYPRSKIERWTHTGGIRRVPELFVKEQCLVDRHIFKLRELEIGSVYVSDKFKLTVEQHKLEGLIFKPVTWNFS